MGPNPHNFDMCCRFLIGAHQCNDYRRSQVSTSYPIIQITGTVYPHSILRIGFVRQCVRRSAIYDLRSTGRSFSGRHHPALNPDTAFPVSMMLCARRATVLGRRIMYWAMHGSQHSYAIEMPSVVSGTAPRCCFESGVPHTSAT